VTDAGFQSGYFSGAFHGPTWPSNTKGKVTSVGSDALLFADPTGASAGLAALVDYERSQGGTYQTLQAPGLGEESQGLAQLTSQQAFYYYGWRVGNSVFEIRIFAGSGSIDQAGALALAEKMDARASG